LHSKQLSPKIALPKKSLASSPPKKPVASYVPGVDKTWTNQVSQSMLLATMMHTSLPAATYVLIKYNACLIPRVVLLIIPGLRVA